MLLHLQVIRAHATANVASGNASRGLTGLPLRHTLEIGADIAAALWHLHPTVIHRDLKPQNVLISSSGAAKVADFGLSRVKVGCLADWMAGWLAGWWVVRIWLIVV